MAPEPQRRMARLGHVARIARVGRLGRVGRLRMALLLATAAALAALACGGPDDAPTGAAATVVTVPPELSIAVEIDGEARPPLDAARLAELPERTREGGPEGSGRRVWLLGDVLGAPFVEPGRRLEVVTSGGQRVVFEDPAANAEAPLALVLNRRGEVLVATLDPAEDDDRHGRGGNRGRGAGEGVRLRGVRELRLLRAGGGGGTGPGAAPARAGAAPPEAPAAAASVAVEVDGEAREPWTLEALRSSPTLPPRPGHGAGGAPALAWSLRELVAERVAPGAVVVRLIGEGGRTLDLDPAAFASAAEVPVLRLNRRGQFRFEWRGEGAVAGEGLRDVRAIHVRRGA